MINIRNGEIFIDHFLLTNLYFFLYNRNSTNGGNMLLIGSHVGYKKEKGLCGSVEETIKNGANTFMFYTGAPQNTARSSIDKELVKQAYTLMEQHQIDPNTVIVHAPYIINLANGEEDKFAFSCQFLKNELQRVAAFGMKYLVLHPGSHVGQGIDVGIQYIITGLNQILEDDTTDVMILLETMAGKGSEVGSRFEELATIIQSVSHPERIGVCLDTCHIHDAGYDLHHFDQVLQEFDTIIGLDKLHCIHVNDSKNEKGSHKDRHENIGFGKIGFDNLLQVIYHKKLENIPKILETPFVDKLYSPYQLEIEMIKNKIFDEQLLEKIKKQYS